PVRRRSSATSANELGPAGLSTSTSPAGLSARGGIGCDSVGEAAAQCLGDLRDRLLARESRRLAVAAAAELTRDRGDIELVDARAQRDAARRALQARRLADQGGHVRALDGAQVVDDPLRVGLDGADLGEVGPE